MQERYIPVDRSGTPGETQPRGQFMLRCLLASRTELGLPSDDEADHDVNIYLTQLLCAYGDPQYCLRVGGYISTYDSTVFERAQTSPSHRFRYTVYKVNADHMLMSIGVFQNPEGRQSESLAPVCWRSDDTFVGRGKTYYDFASAYSQRVFGRSSGVSDVLGKMSSGFEQYVKLLTHLRGEYFDLVTRLSDSELYHLQKASSSVGLEALRNEFLDLYSAWRHDPTPEAHAKLLEAAARLKRLDPSLDLGTLQ